MKILHSDTRKGEVTVIPEHLDDLWDLSTIIEKGDLLKAQTVRKIKIGESTERSGSIVKKTVTLTIQVEQIDFSPQTQSSLLRVGGAIAEGFEDIPKGSHHTISIEPHMKITFQKHPWPAYAWNKLQQAAKTKQAPVLLCVMDREEAHIARLKPYGYEVLTTIKGDVAKKRDDHHKQDTFYKEILTYLEEQDRQTPVDAILIASPAFWKEDFKKAAKDHPLTKKMTLATVSSSDATAFNELLKRQEVKQVLQQDRISKEMKLVEEVLTEISKGTLGVYGLQEVKRSIEHGATKCILITDMFIKEAREQKRYAPIEALLKQAEMIKAEVHLISSMHDSGKRLDGLGGIAGILRYQMR
ncbi:mRNA surveillance protein pelota [Candidatus Woesearchaeota archaeon]|nr:mRNA surveillance protein pelota [Candidatus Woesearchaeota archaeon]